MHGIALLTLGCLWPMFSLALDKDVEVLDYRMFSMPIQIKVDGKRRAEKGRLFVSEDAGKSWIHVKDFEPSDKELIYSAKDDGLYWFAVQLQLANGDHIPASEKKLEPAMKVFVNTLGRPVSKLKTYGDLLKETEELRRTLDEVQRKLKRLETPVRPE